MKRKIAATAIVGVIALLVTGCGDVTGTCVAVAPDRVSVTLHDYAGMGTATVKSVDIKLTGAGKDTNLTLRFRTPVKMHNGGLYMGIMKVPANAAAGATGCEVTVS